MKDEGKKPSGVALLIGISRYAHFEPISVAHRDAQALAKALSGHGFEKESVHLLTDESAHRDAIAQAFNLWLPQKAQGAGTAFLYFAGHGVMQSSDPRGEAYLLPFDAAFEDPARSGIAMSEVARWIDRLDAERVILCFDCCRSTSDISSKVVAGRTTRFQFPTSTFRWNVDAMPSGKSRFLLALESTCDKVQGTRELKHGRFTHYLLQSIKEVDLDKAKTNLVVDLLTHVWESITDEGWQHLERPTLTSSGELISVEAGFSGQSWRVVASESRMNVSSSTAASSDDWSDDDGGHRNLVDDQPPSGDFVPDFFQDEDDSSLRSRAEWLDGHLGLGNQFFARLLGAEVGTIQLWREGGVALSPSQNEGLQQFWRTILHLQSFVNYDVNRLKTLIENQVPSEIPAGLGPAYSPSWKGSSIHDYLEQRGIIALSEVDRWVTSLRFGSHHAA